MVRMSSVTYLRLLDRTETSVEEDGSCISDFLSSSKNQTSGSGKAYALPKIYSSVCICAENRSVFFAAVKTATSNAFLSGATLRQMTKSKLSQKLRGVVRFCED